MKSNQTAQDMLLKEKLFPRLRNFPFSCVYGGKPSVFTEENCVFTRVNAETTVTTTMGRLDGHLSVVLEAVEYLDYPVREYTVTLKNTSDSDSLLLEDFRGPDFVLEGGVPTLLHGDGDRCVEDCYNWFEDRLDKPLTLQTADETSCNGAFPYMRFVYPDHSVNMAIGWPGRWQVKFLPEGDGVRVRAGLARCHMVIHAGETIRSPRVTLMACAGDEDRVRNMWRRWYFAHILPRPLGKPLPPKYILHTWNLRGFPEFTDITERDQLEAIDTYIKNGVKPDLWWIDAGWYSCRHDWCFTGTWEPSPNRFPNGLGPVGEKCLANDIDLLVWFEPERARPGTEIYDEHPDWLLTQTSQPDNPNKRVYLGNRECCDFIIERVDRLIKEGHITVYRQDFNWDHCTFWEENEAEDRVGAMENQHMQGYLRFWDAILERNPGLWIDSCAGGGRRNDLETMRRAVPLQFTDMALGKHSVKCKQIRQMYEWLPYFRTHNMNWDGPDGDYLGHSYPPDEFSFYVAMAPAITDVTEYTADENAMALCRRMKKIWEKASAIELDADYYPLTPRSDSREVFYAMQFHNPETGIGMAEVISQNKNPETEFTLRLRALRDDAVYVLTDSRDGSRREVTGRRLKDGITVTLPRRSGMIVFYEEKQ